MTTMYEKFKDAFLSGRLNPDRNSNMETMRKEMLAKIAEAEAAKRFAQYDDVQFNKGSE